VRGPRRAGGGRGRNGTELLDTLRHYLDHNAGVEATARALGVHRNTLRARLRTAERVMGRSLDVPRHRLELWAALALEQDGAPGHRR
jgi:purine catabolism regulator